MISILIPVFNTVILKLVQQLNNQCLQSKIEYEILIIDDGSDLKYLHINKSVSEYINVQYSERGVNRGRIYTRIELADRAKFNYLLFLDSDSTINNTLFIDNYSKALFNKADVIIGGTTFPAIKPNNCAFALHWKYAHNRVNVNKKRDKSSLYTGFLFNNVMIQKTIFEKLTFSSLLQGYGHEDTWVGIQLEELNARLMIIDNPVMHESLDDTNLFLHKSRNALYNLKALAQITDVRTLNKHVRIFKYYTFLEKYQLGYLFTSVINFIKKGIKRNLRSCNPYLYLFDLYRLELLLSIMKNKN